MTKLFTKRILLLLAIAATTVAVNAATAGGDVLMDYLMRSAMLIPDDFAMSLGQEFRYNDNINQTSRGERSTSWISETDANMQLTRTIDHFTYGVKLGGSYEHYFHKQDDDSSDFTYNFSPVMIGDLPFDVFGGKLMLSFNSAYERENVDGDSNRTSTVFRNKANAAWDAQLTGHVSLVTTANISSDRYNERGFSGLDKNNYGFSISPTYRYSERTRFGLTGGYNLTEYRNHADHDDYDDIKLGTFLEHIINERTAAWLEMGATKLSYKNNSASDDSNRSNDWEFYFNSRIVYQALENLSFGFVLSRDVEDSTSSKARGNRVVTELAEVTTWNITSRITLAHRLSLTIKDEHTNSSDYNLYESDLQLRFCPSRNFTYYAGWNISDACYDHESYRNYVENEWRIGMKFNY